MSVDTGRRIEAGLLGGFDSRPAAMFLSSNEQDNARHD